MSEAAGSGGSPEAGDDVAGTTTLEAPRIGDGIASSPQPEMMSSASRDSIQQSGTGTDAPRIGGDDLRPLQSQQATELARLGTGEEGGPASAETQAALSEASQQTDSLAGPARSVQEVPALSDEIEGIDDQGNTEAGALWEMWQREGQQMRPIIKYLHEQRAEQWNSARWQELNAEQRLQFLQEVQNTVAREYHFNPARVTVGSEEAMKKVTGEFYTDDTTSDGGRLFVGRIQINEQRLDDPFKAVSTILHESRHAFQWSGIQNPAIVPERLRQEIPTWRDNFAHPISARQDLEGYWNQAIERDARAFAGVARVLYDSGYRNSLTGESANNAARIQAEYKKSQGGN